MTERFLEGRTAWVTGGLSPVGQATVLALADAGANIAFCSSVSDGTGCAAPEWQRLAQAVRSRGVGYFAADADMRVNADADRFHEAAVFSLGPIDLLVNAASISAREEMLKHRDEIWDATLDVNLHGAYRATKRCMASMIERRFGRIVNIASTAARVGYPGYGAYCASSAALLGLTRCVALEGAEHGITCNALSPGWVDPSVRWPDGNESAAEKGRVSGTRASVPGPEAMPQMRLIPPREVASFIVFLCGDEALGLTGELITIAGGAWSVDGSTGCVW